MIAQKFQITRSHFLTEALPFLQKQVVSMCNQMVTSEIREGKLLGFGQNASEIIP